ncbi:hypothetical protein GTQ40_00175 [Flavobacteriaceae bacterium R38]|nr:hypothetical protein [Flavobacteriaceae bacterium R38]
MKKKKFNTKLDLKKSMVSKLDSTRLSGGGNGNVSTNPQCIFTGPELGCEVTCNCLTENGCGPATAGCNPNETQLVFSCEFPCQ